MKMMMMIVGIMMMVYGSSTVSDPGIPIGKTLFMTDHISLGYP